LSWVIIGFVVVLTIFYIVISILFPEWVGMTGKKALQIQKEQEEESTSKSPQQNL
jgi:type II secretory pathway pseudopilin PulG